MATPRFIVFDWDGTAVVDRETGSASHLIPPLESILASGFLAYIVTGTSHRWVAAQLRELAASLAPRIAVCCNRGSEVYRLGLEGASLIHRRRMTAAEQRDIDEVGQALAAPLLAAGHDVRIISERLNRIKVDLLPEWAEPPKHRIDDVVRLVDARFGGFGGLCGLLRVAAELAAGVPSELRLTSDAKHVEIGITDKADSMVWVLDDVSRHGGTVADLIVVGDEFGPMGGLEGSDAKTAVRGATIYSVGSETNGVPEGIQHLGGGPAQFVRILESLAAGRPPTKDASTTRRILREDVV